MSKIKRITVSNLKAVSLLTADFNGCTAIVTGGNNKGKTSFLRSLFDRVRGIKPEMVLKQGETEGFAEAELTTGEKIRWEFNDKGKGFKEKLTYITEKDIKAALSTELRDKFLPGVFNVDKFLQDQPAKQRKTLQELVGLDFTDIDARYKSAYDDREAKNRRYNESKIVFDAIAVPEKIDAVNVSDLISEKETTRTKLNELYLQNKKDNEALRKDWITKCENLRKEITDFNQKQTENRLSYNKCFDAVSVLEKEGIDLPNDLLKGKEAAILNNKEYIQPAEPDYKEELPDDSELLAIEEKINQANDTNRKAQDYSDYISQKEKLESAKSDAETARLLVTGIETERMNLIKSAKMPEGFGFSDDGITYCGLPFTREQLSSSGIYVAALKLAAMTLGEIKALHFDASFLDKNSLLEIEKWATGEGLQLLIERPDFEGGEIEYQLIQE